MISRRRPFADARTARRRGIAARATLGAVLLTAALAACGSDARPGAGAAAPVMPPQAVSLPIPPVRQPSAPAPPLALAAAVAEAARAFHGRLGIAIRAVDEGWTVEDNARQHLPQQSVSKLWVAMTLLDLRDQGRAKLDDPVLVRPEDLTLFHQPIAALVRGGGYQTTVGDLLRRALTQSDNTANDRLLTYVGGPGAVRAMIERKRLGGIRFGPGERVLQAHTAGLEWRPALAISGAFERARAHLSPAARAAALDAYVANPPDGAEPLAIADALARLARGELLSETSTRVLLDTMGMSITGRARLRAAMPGGWQIAHKTGTGQDLGGRNAGFNDVGLLTAPDGRRYALAVMIGDTREPTTARQHLIQSVAASVTRYATETRGSGAG